MGTSWNPGIYKRYSDERTRPFFELIARVNHRSPAQVVDLGCGTGAQTSTLAQLWPEANIVGIDSSPNMVAEQPDNLPTNVSVVQGDIADFDASGIDVVISNAALQWVPRHRELLEGWSAQLNVDGVLAWQVPGNFDAPSHGLMRRLAESDEWSPLLGGVLRGGESVDTPEQYASAAIEAGLIVDAWETTYLHVLQGEDPVLNWVRGTGLRPVLDALDDERRPLFVEQYRTLLREAYPPTRAGTLFPFRRIFVVARKG